MNNIHVHIHINIKIYICMYGETSNGLLGVPQGSLKWASEQSLVNVEIVCSEITCAFCAYLVFQGIEMLNSMISIEHTCDALKVADWRVSQTKAISSRRVWWLSELDHNTPKYFAGSIVSQVVGSINTSEKTRKSPRFMESVCSGPGVAPGFDNLHSLDRGKASESVKRGVQGFSNKRRAKDFLQPALQNVFNIRGV